MIISARFLEVPDHLELVIQVLKVQVSVKQRMILLPIVALFRIYCEIPLYKFFLNTYKYGSGRKKIEFKD